MRKTLLLALALSLMPVAASAQTPAPTPTPAVDTRALTPEQVAQLQLKADQLRSATPEGSTVNELEKWRQYSEVGKAVGAGLGEAARSLGVAVNEFAGTPVGQLTMFLIVWKLIGSQLLGVILGAIWFGITLTLWVKYFRKMAIVESEETVTAPDGTKTTTVKNFDPGDDDVAVTRIVMLLVFCFLVATPTFFMMF